jgi:hypothetical protein
MTPEDFERLKDTIVRSFLEGTEAVADDVKRTRVAERIQGMKEQATLAAETIDLANELAADGDPHKQRLAQAIKDAVTGGAERLHTGGEGQLDASPFSKNSEPSAKGLPGSTPALPPAPQKRGPGRPRKDKT